MLNDANLRGLMIDDLARGRRPLELADVQPRIAGNTVVILSDSRGQMCNPFAYGASGITSMVRASDVVTVTQTSHGYLSGQKVRVLNASPSSFNGDYSITRTGANTYTYTAAGADESADVSAASICNLQALSGRGFFVYANGLLGGRLTLLRNASVGGNTTGQMLERVASDVIAYSPQWCIDFGFYNDIGTSGYTSDTTIANKLAIYQALLAHNIRVIAVTETPLSSSGSKWSAANNEWILAVNRWMRGYCRSTPGMVLADPYRLTVDTANTTNRGTILAAMIDTDNVHIVGRGQYYVGKAIASAVSSIIPANSPLVASAAECAVAGVNNFNAIDNAPWSNSGGTVTTASGTAASGITVERASGSGTGCVASVVARSDGGYDQQIVVTPAGVETWNIRSNTGGTIVTRYAEGEYRRLIAEVSVSWASASTLIGLTFNATFTVDGTSYTVSTLGGVATANAIDEVYTLTLMSNPIRIPAGSITNSGWTLQSDFSGASANAVTIKVGRVSFVQTSDTPA